MSSKKDVASLEVRFDGRTVSALELLTVDEPLTEADFRNAAHLISNVVPPGRFEWVATSWRALQRFRVGGVSDHESLALFISRIGQQGMPHEFVLAALLESLGVEATTQLAERLGPMLEDNKLIVMRSIVRAVLTALARLDALTPHFDWMATWCLTLPNTIRWSVLDALPEARRKSAISNMLAALETRDAPYKNLSLKLMLEALLQHSSEFEPEHIARIEAIIAEMQRSNRAPRRREAKLLAAQLGEAAVREALTRDDDGLTPAGRHCLDRWLESQMEEGDLGPTSAATPRRAADVDRPVTAQHDGTTLSFTGYVVLDEKSELSPTQRAQIDAERIFDDAWETAEEDSIAVEYVDVVDETGTTRYQAYFWPVGSAVFFEAGSVKMVADAIQHSFHRCADLELWKALGSAYEQAEPKVQEMISFKPPR